MTTHTVSHHPVRSDVPVPASGAPTTGRADAIIKAREAGYGRAD